MADNDKLNVQVIKGGLYQEMVEEIKGYTEEKKILIELLKGEPEIEKVTSMSKIEAKEGMSAETMYELDIFNRNRFTYHSASFDNMYIHFYSYREKQDLWSNICNGIAVVTDVFNECIFNKLKFATIDGNIHFHLTQTDDIDGYNSYICYFSFTVEEKPKNFNKIFKKLDKTYNELKKLNLIFVEDMHIKEMKSYMLKDKDTFIYNFLFNFKYIDKTKINLN